MHTFINHIQHRLIPNIPAWLFLFAGIALTAMATLTPAWLQCRQLAWQQNVITLQADRLAQQQLAYDQFLNALKQDNPIVLQRLAYERLLAIPQQATLISPEPNHHTRNYPRTYPQTTPQPTKIAIAQWLHRPLPQPGIDYQPLPPIRTYLTRITQGPARLLLIAFAGVLLAFAFIPPKITS